MKITQQDRDRVSLGIWSLVVGLLTFLAIDFLLSSATYAHAEKPYDVCSGVLLQDHGKLLIGFEENGEPVEGSCLLPVSERNRILQACKLQQKCTVVGIIKPTCGPDCTSMAKVVSVFAGNVKD
jgi:hypothetical protein